MIRAAFAIATLVAAFSLTWIAFELHRANERPVPRSSTSAPACKPPQCKLPIG